MLKDIFVIPEFNGQFDKLTDLTEGLFQVPELAEGAYLFIALAYAAAAFITPAYAEFHSYCSFQLPVLHSPILPSLALQVFKTRKVKERIRKGFFLAQARTRTYIASIQV